MARALATRRQLSVGLAAALATPAFVGHARAAEKSRIVIGRAYGLIYMATYVMEGRKLVEQHATRLGLPEAAVQWNTFGGGGAVTDSLLAGGIDVVCSGIGNLLLLWDRTKGGVKGLISTSAQPLDLITREPGVKTLRDFALPNKIAVPTLKVSTHAVLLQIAAAQMYGADKWDHFDPMTVQLSHPDAMASMMNPHHEVTSHFSAVPYSYFEKLRVPGAKVVIRSNDIVGGPVAAAQMFVTTRFADANPTMLQAIRAATLESLDIIRNNTAGAVETYRTLSGDRTRTEDLLAALHEPGMLDYIAAPQGTMKIATHLANTGVIKTRPKAWTDYYLPMAHDLDGN